MLIDSLLCNEDVMAEGVGAISTPFPRTYRRRFRSLLRGGEGCWIFSLVETPRNETRTTSIKKKCFNILDLNVDLGDFSSNCGLMVPPYNRNGKVRVQNKKLQIYKNNLVI